jgi:hypothetical protein
MKKVLLSIALFISVSVNAQNDQARHKRWIALDMDSLEFVNRFGNECEYDFQKNVNKSSSTGYGAVFIGAKWEYLSWFTKYMDGIYNFDYAKNHTFYYSHHITNSGSQKIKLHFLLGKNERVGNVTITGPADDIIKIFIDYWDARMSFNSLKTKHNVFKDLASDRVSLTWNGANPTITITNVPNRQYVPKGCNY